MQTNNDGSVTFSSQEIMALRQAISQKDLEEITIPSIPVHVVRPNRRQRVIARCVLGVFLIAVGLFFVFNLSNDSIQAKQTKYSTARVLDAIRVSRQYVPPDEMNFTIGTSELSGIPKYPLPPHGQEASRLALDSILLNAYTSGPNQYDLFVLTIGYGIVGTGIGLILLQPFRS